MKKILLSALLFFAVSQSKSQDHSGILNNIVSSYNAKDYSALAKDFGSNILNAFPVNKLQEALDPLHGVYGKIINTEKSNSNAGWDIYKTTFEKGVLDMKLAVDPNLKVIGFTFVPHVDVPSPSKTTGLLRNKSELSIPFKGEWTVFWGGDDAKVNAHHNFGSQKYAFDLVVFNDKNLTYKTDGKTNEDYFAFGKELVAPCDAEVSDVVDGIRDNIPGQENKMYVPGNSVVLKTANNEYLFFAHFKQNSIKVKPGQKIKKGQLLGLCGNSGNSSEPHLHFHIQNSPDINTAEGIKCFFKELKVKSNGKEDVKSDYSPVKDEVIFN